MQDNQIWSQLTTRHVKPRAEEEKAARYGEHAWTAEDIETAVNRAVTAALKRHKERGESVVQWRDGKIVTLKPEEIEI